MRVGAVGSRPDDHEGCRRVAPAIRASGDIGGDGGFGTTGSFSFAHARAWIAVDGGARSAQRLDLIVVLTIRRSRSIAVASTGAVPVAAMSGMRCPADIESETARTGSPRNVRSASG